MMTAFLRIRNWFSFPRIDNVWITIIAILMVLAAVDNQQILHTIRFTINAIIHTAPFIIVAVLAIGLLKATGSEKVIARAFQGKEAVMIILASLIGGMSPFCSCEVIPFVAAMLVAGTPLSAVMAFWLASPLMDPAIFVITVAELGWNFAIAKTVIAIMLGLAAGFAIYYMVRLGYFADVRLADSPVSCCGSVRPLTGKPVWKFWEDQERVDIFRSAAVSNGFFLFKWLFLAYLIESLMIRYIPASAIAAIVGGEGIQPIMVSAFIGAPAYLNGYAAPAIVSTLMEQGMTSGSAMAFMIAGGITSIPAMTAVFALVKKQLFAAYLMLGIAGAILSGIFYELYIMSVI